MNVRRTAAALTSAAALSVTGIAMAQPAQAAPNNANQNGLVNLALQDTTVQLPIALAANVCGVAVNVLATATGSGPVTCTAEGVSTAERQRGGPNNARQNGLVNVAVQGTTVQVPIAVAANVCGVTVNAISSLNLVGETSCDALANPGAQG